MKKWLQVTEKENKMLMIEPAAGKTFLALYRSPSGHFFRRQKSFNRKHTMENISVNYDSKQDISRFLQEQGIRLQKRWGQNFLINRGAREKLVSLLDLKEGDLVWEVGPGLGPMTDMLLKAGSQLTVFEIDRGLIRILEQLFASWESFSLVAGDVLKTWKAWGAERGYPTKLLGNLPYSSASAIIASFIDAGLSPQKMVFTVQKELAQRITASPGNKNYSSFSIFCQFAFSTSFKGDLKAGSFFPAPDVVSSIILMEPVKREVEPVNRELFLQLIRLAFQARRKTLRNNLINSPLAAQLGKERIITVMESQGLPENCRGEVLSVEDFIDLSNRLAADS